MDGSGGTPPSSQNTTVVPPLLTPLRLISLGQLFEPNQPPSLFRDILNINSMPPSLHDNNLYQMMLVSQMLDMPLPMDVMNAPAPAPAPEPAHTDVSDGGATPSTDASATDVSADTVPWEERCLTLPARGIIRLLTPPSDVSGDSIEHLWDTDYTLTGWHELTETNPAAADVFFANQRKRWLAWKVWYRLTQRIWCRRTQCNVDMIDMAQIPDKDAILVTDTAHRLIYRFHRRDLFNTLLSNICLSDEMLPNPRAPRNPWTNAPFTYGQLVGVCQLLLQDYAQRGQCPPVLFSAFWAAQFDVRRFATENASLLGQHAIVAYFKDINDHNRETVADTINTLLADSGVSFAPVNVRRWLRASPLTPAHREWLALARDYTLYMNLHVQVRPHWHSEDAVYRDVRRLNQRYPIADSAGPRLRMLRTMGATPGPGVAEAPASADDSAIVSMLTHLFGPRTGPHGIDETLENIQNSLFGGRGSGGRG